MRGMMGTFNVAIEVGALEGQHFRSMDALVDTGSTLTSIDEDVLHQLGIQPVGTRRFRMGDDVVNEYPVGYARVRLQGQEVIVLVVFLPSGASPLVGDTTLELLGLAVDPVAQQLVSVDLLLKQQSAE
jgi:clan AA aspartic protease